MAVKRAAIFHKFKGQMLYYLVPVSIKNRVTFVSQNKRGVRFVTFFWVSFFLVWVREGELLALEALA